MDRRWLLKRLARLGLLATVPLSMIVAVLHGWNRVAEFLNGGWSPWVGNVANVLQIAAAIAALTWWLASIACPRGNPSAGGLAVQLLRLLALLLPSRDRDRFVREVTATLADFPRSRERIRELLSVAAAMPWIAAILRWARRRRA